MIFKFIRWGEDALNSSKSALNPDQSFGKSAEISSSGITVSADSFAESNTIVFSGAGCDGPSPQEVNIETSKTVKKRRFSATATPPRGLYPNSQ
jgi:hypothetical protein